MGLSRSARIITLLVIDGSFFFVELIAGYAVGSLALVADSFHMLNDVLSLFVALYTIKLAQKPSNHLNSYGWQRAEILGALINGVFLVALCVSIALEALGRFISPSDITNPKIIVIVGSLGLLSNIVGLFLFHEHGHSHGGHSHGPPALPESPEPSGDGLTRQDSHSSLYTHPAITRAQVIETAQEFGYGKPDGDFQGPMSPPSTRHVRAPSRGSKSRPGRTRTGSGTPAVPKAGTNETLNPASSTAEEASSSASTGTAVGDTPAEHDHAGHDHGKDVGDAEEGHGHGGGGHGHDHGSMNMRGVFLHVVGDALGNVGVIATGLIIWFAKGRWRFYFDPAVSLLITVIIFSSAIPLVKSASYILMQAVPSHISLEAVRGDIKDVDGVVSVHELHVWQLSESTLVASVHVLISTGKDHMVVANGIREKLHRHGIHSVTIQPEFVSSETVTDDDYSETACLIRCPPESCDADTCCPPAVKVGTLVDVEEHEEHDHDHDHEGHSH
ncbi:solute carrier family 30 (zinc transporter), member 1, partial [Tremellales sp. Uapishka_1]